MKKLGMLLAVGCLQIYGAVQVLQSTQCDSAGTTELICTPVSDAATNTIYIAIVEYAGSYACSANDISSNLQSANFTLRVTARNLNGTQAASCIYTANITTSGPNNVSFFPLLATVPVSMFLFEIPTSGAPATGGGTVAPTFASGTGTGDAVATVTTSSMITANNDAIMFCGPASNPNANAWTSVTPTGGTTNLVVGSGYASGSLWRKVSAGTFTCSFTKSVADTVSTIAGLIVSYSLVPTLISHTTAKGPSTQTSAAINTTGANFIVMNLAALPGAVVSDSKANTWNALTPAGTNGQSTLRYCSPCTVGTGHTFTWTGTTLNGSMQVAAFSGVKSSTPLETQATGTGGVTTATNCTPGTITVSQSAVLFIEGYEKENDTSTYVMALPNYMMIDVNPFLGSNYYGAALAYRVGATVGNTTVSAFNSPTQGRNGCTHASFLPAPSPAARIVSRSVASAVR